MTGANFSEELEVGTELNDSRYTIVGFLNAGGFGMTYLAKNTLDAKVVIKECYPQAICRRDKRQVSARNASVTDDFESSVNWFRKEARKLSTFKHPQIVRVHDLFDENGTSYMVLDYIEGRDLYDTVENYPEEITPEFVVKAATKLLPALRYIHEHDMLHRDIAPDNIMLDRKGDPVFIDFGAAREQATRASRALSSLQVVKDGYSPQEFYVVGSAQGPYSDLYALAATLRHLVTKTAPPSSQARSAAIVQGEADPLMPLAGSHDGYPEGFLAAIDRGLEVAPRSRWQSAQDWIDAISGRAATRVLSRDPAPEDAVATRLLSTGSEAASAAAAGQPQPQPVVTQGSTMPRGVVIGGGVLAAAALAAGLYFGTDLFRPDRAPAEPEPERQAGPGDDPEAPGPAEPTELELAALGWLADLQSRYESVLAGIDARQEAAEPGRHEMFQEERREAFNDFVASLGGASILIHLPEGASDEAVAAAQSRLDAALEAARARWGEAVSPEEVPEEVPEASGSDPEPETGPETQPELQTGPSPEAIAAAEAWLMGLRADFTETLAEIEARQAAAASPPVHPFFQRERRLAYDRFVEEIGNTDIIDVLPAAQVTDVAAEALAELRDALAAAEAAYAEAPEPEEGPDADRVAEAEAFLAMGLADLSAALDAIGARQAASADPAGDHNSFQTERRRAYGSYLAEVRENSALDVLPEGRRTAALEEGLELLRASLADADARFAGPAEPEPEPEATAEAVIAAARARLEAAFAEIDRLQSAAGDARSNHGVYQNRRREAYGAFLSTIRDDPAVSALADGGRAALEDGLGLLRAALAEAEALYGADSGSGETPQDPEPGEDVEARLAEVLEQLAQDLRQIDRQQQTDPDPARHDEFQGLRQQAMQRYLGALSRDPVLRDLTRDRRARAAMEGRDLLRRSLDDADAAYGAASSPAPSDFDASQFDFLPLPPSRGGGPKFSLSDLVGTAGERRGTEQEFGAAPVTAAGLRNQPSDLLGDPPARLPELPVQEPVATPSNVQELGTNISLQIGFSDTDVLGELRVEGIGEPSIANQLSEGDIVTAVDGRNIGNLDGLIDYLGEIRTRYDTGGPAAADQRNMRLTVRRASGGRVDEIVVPLVYCRELSFGGEQRFAEVHQSRVALYLIAQGQTEYCGGSTFLRARQQILRETQIGMAVRDAATLDEVVKRLRRDGQAGANFDISQDGQRRELFIPLDVF